MRLKKFVDSHNGFQPTDELLRIMAGRSMDLMQEHCRQSLEAILEQGKPDLLVLDDCPTHYAPASNGYRPINPRSSAL
jgi:hypothetical protein